ncbi:MAG: hypothetical protein SAK29_34845 [Scytonema sp. PMC 1069.18]|nr:hypothetical protein [Scytonema sp. PMC 1069.18]MEC4887817.1 hypothetical protein [Scytonema sp. PMC 1070.18]
MMAIKDCLVGERCRFVGSAQILTRLGGVSFETAGVLFACDFAHQGDRLYQRQYYGEMLFRCILVFLPLNLFWFQLLVVRLFRLGRVLLGCNRIIHEFLNF